MEELLPQLVEKLVEALPGREITFELDSGLIPVRIDPQNIHRVVTQLAHCLDGTLPADAGLQLVAQSLRGRTTLQFADAGLPSRQGLEVLDLLFGL